MAHSKKALSRNGTSDLGGTNQTNFYMYSTNSTLAQMIAAGYFNDSRKTVKVNDIVRAVYDKDGTPGFAILRFTAVPSTGNVTVSLESVGVASLAALTEDSGAIGGTNDGDLPDLAATTNAITDSTGGTPSTTALANLADGSTYATDHGAIENNFATLGAEAELMKADIASLTAAVRELATRINELTGG